MLCTLHLELSLHLLAGIYSNLFPLFEFSPKSFHFTSPLPLVSRISCFHTHCLGRHRYVHEILVSKQTFNCHIKMLEQHMDSYWTSTLLHRLTEQGGAKIQVMWYTFIPVCACEDMSQQILKICINFNRWTQSYHITVRMYTQSCYVRT